MDDLFITGILLCGTAGPLLLLFMLRHPQVVEEFGGRMPDPPAGGGAGMAACDDTEGQEAGRIGVSRLRITGLVGRSVLRRKPEG